LVLAYRTSEVANDRYIYSETLYRVTSGSLSPLRHERFFYEIAGLEVLTVRILWLFNFACVGVISAMIRLRSNLRGSDVRIPGA